MITPCQIMNILFQFDKFVEYFFLFPFVIPGTFPEHPIPKGHML